MASLSLLVPLIDYWRQLREGTRDNIIGGLVVALIIGVAVVFRDTLISAAKRLIAKNPPSVVPTPQQSPQQITVKLEGLQVSPTSIQPPAAKQQTLVPQIPRTPITGFVARRDAEGHEIVSRLREELGPEKDQLLVLWGAGGVGKTTLAAEAARSLRQDFAGRIVWISAEGRPDFTLSTLLDEIATYLGRADLRQLALAAKDDQVRDALADAPATLIVLDNFETVDPAEQDLCAGWLAKRASCPTLVTSRDEVVHARPVHILAMSFPEAREFLQRLLAQVRNPRAFEAIDGDQIIGVADRIPLVLQWLVKQIDSAKQPQAVLDDLTRGEGDAAKRVFDRSFDLPQVGNDGRAALLALSLFIPSATRTALAEVAGFGRNTERLDRALQQLTELWLVEATHGNERFRVEGLTRELAKARLSKVAQVDGLRRRFVFYFLTYTQAHAQPNPEDYDALETEKGNVIGAIDLAFDLENWNSIQEIVFILTDPEQGMLSVRGYWDETIRLLKQALQAAGATNSEWYVGAFTTNLGAMFLEQGYYSLAREQYQLAVEVARRLDLKQELAATLHHLGVLARREGGFEEARARCNESLQINKEIHYQSGIADNLLALAILDEGKGELDQARQLYSESLEIYKELGDERGIATSLYQLGRVAQNRGEARQFYLESLEILKRFGDQNGIASTLHQLARVAEDAGNNAEAAKLFREALAIFEKLKSSNAEIARQSLERVKGKSK